ncbi:hypothetical protein WR25_13742 [Diploscapter pachys]|uniref:Uncharacterized protein n=1 Tax=Diploscapter pachys TaxID=2018661 RepID=A0A2A2L651_9BILA|nr:hypothetical protein WR25_13742 [Diploscapter pachys]
MKILQSFKKKTTKDSSYHLSSLKSTILAKRATSALDVTPSTSLEKWRAVAKEGSSCRRSSCSRRSYKLSSTGRKKLSTLFNFDAAEFRRNILRYNLLLSFASICYNSVGLKHNGIATAKVQGAPFHRPSTLFPSNLGMLVFANFRVYDRQKGIDMRKQHFDDEETQEKIIEKLADFFKDHNPFVHFHMRLKEKTISSKTRNSPSESWTEQHIKSYAGPETIEMREKGNHVSVFDVGVHEFASVARGVNIHSIVDRKQSWRTMNYYDQSTVRWPTHCYVKMMSSCMLIVEKEPDRIVLYNSQLRHEPSLHLADPLKASIIFKLFYVIFFLNYLIHLKIGDWVRVGLYSNLNIAYIDPIPLQDPPVPTRVVESAVQILSTVHFSHHESAKAESDDFGPIGVRKQLRVNAQIRGQTLKAWVKRLQMHERAKLAETLSSQPIMIWGVMETLDVDDQKIRLCDKLTMMSRKGEHAMALSAIEESEGEDFLIYSLHNNIGALIDEFNALKLGTQAKFETQKDVNFNESPVFADEHFKPCPPEKYRMRYGLITTVRAYEEYRVAFVWSLGCYPMRQGKLTWKKGTLVEGQWIRFYTRGDMKFNVYSICSSSEVTLILQVDDKVDRNV